VNLRCRSETWCVRLAGNAGPKKSPKIHHLGTVAHPCRAISSQLRHTPTIGKKLFKQQYLLHMSPQCGELRPTKGWDQFGCLGHPCKFQRVCVLAALLHGTLVVGISQTLRRWTEGTTYIRQGGHHTGHWPISLVELNMHKAAQLSVKAPHHNRSTALFPGPPRSAGARRELLHYMVQGKINRGRNTDHPAGRHSIQANQCPPPLKSKWGTTRMWANAQRDGRPAEYRWHPLLNAAKFGWRPLLECRAVTRWNLPGAPNSWTELSH